ncbi:MAG: methylthioribulose 1-phosphate dehydratase [Nitrospirota bacterium]|nr:methylthioribulose 1-phosphate dehydratase [Nitrospirota bacterium]
MAVSKSHGAASDAEREFDTRAVELITAGRFIHARGWVPATSGNFSARLSDGSIAITVSARHKGDLKHPGDIMRVDAQGKSLDGQKPSAETLLHTSLYRRYPKVGAVLHPHSTHATLISRLCTGGLVLEGYELLKALEGIDTHETRVVIPIFSNDQNIPRLSAKVEKYLDSHGEIFGYILAGHGFYTWGASVADALRHVEALEHLFELETRLYGVKHP